MRQAPLFPENRVLGFMRYLRLAVSALVLLFSTPLIHTQEAPLVPQGMEALRTRALLRNDFTFDESMLRAASQLMPDEDRPIIAKLRSISVHNFKFPAAGYDPAALETVRAQYAGNGWNHVLTKQTHPPAQAPAGALTDASGAPISPTPAKPFDPTRTDVWARMDHGNFNGVVLMVANDRMVNLVVIDGMISPLDLLHLRGHFGIPRFEAGGRE
jgi:hypothetical protein